MLYQIKDGSVSLGGKQILSHIDFEVRGTEKIGIVGANGAGKTTLLRLISGELTLDRDDRRMGPGITSSRKLTIGMMSQTREKDKELTVEELMLSTCPEKDAFSRERYAYEMEYDRLFTGFGFDKQDKQKQLGRFSGGEQTKISLIHLLLQKPDLLLLDEPTNHLDVETAEWLETYMQEYPKAVIFVSHDRFFLDRVVDVIYELRKENLYRYVGNYSDYRKQKQKEQDDLKKNYEKQQKEIARLEGLIEKFKNKPRKASFARSRKTLLDRMEKMEKPSENEGYMFTKEILPLVPANKWVMEAKELGIGYDKILLEISLRVRNGQKIAVIGKNGSGKSTFLKTVAGYLEPKKGECILGERTTLGYFDQQSAEISSEKTVLEHFHGLFPGLTEKDARQTLSCYLFRGRNAQTKVASLSGGEKARLMLAELLCAGPNMLVLDEPTNHMDIQAKETLESAFKAYKGTILFVSHDRYFVHQVADAILLFDEQRVMYYPFGYMHYLERKRREGAEDPAALMRAEDQAMLEGFRAVPEKERHRLREISTEAAYFDWQLRLAGEQMEDAKRKAELLWLKWKEWGERIPETPEEWMNMEAFAMEELEKAEEEWTEACLAWDQIYSYRSQGEL